MEHGQENNNSYFITIYSIKYLELQKTYETYLQNLIETYIYQKSIYPIYKEVLVRMSWSIKPRTSLQ